MQAHTLHTTTAFIRTALAGAVADGQPRWLRSVEVMNLLPSILPGIRVTHEERHTALLRDILRASAETEWSLLRAGFAPEVVASVVRLTRFDAVVTYLDHIRAVAESNDLAAKRVAMAALHREERRAAAGPAEPEERRVRRHKAMALLQRGLGY